jgi:uncharacterized protein YndB with AHSA1/START domain
VTEIQYEADIRCTAEKIFDAIVDLRGYDRWLTTSKGYLGTTDISSDPVALGTTYIESSPAGVRYGTVTEFEPPTQVTFHQPMSMKPRFLGSIDIHLCYTLTPAAASTHVRRVCTVTIHWPLKLAQRSILREFRTENERTLLALKGFAEGPVQL